MAIVLRPAAAALCLLVVITRSPGVKSQPLMTTDSIATGHPGMIRSGNMMADEGHPLR